MKILNIHVLFVLALSTFAMLPTPLGLSIRAAEAEQPDSDATAASILEAEWQVYVVDGGTPEARAVNLLPATTPLENYTENLRRISPEFARVNRSDKRYAVPDAYESDKITVTEIGPWYGYTVFDLCNTRAKHRSIMLRDDTGNYRILYTQIVWGSATFDASPHLVEVQDQTLLVYRSGTGGSGGYQVEYYFLFDPEIRRPVALSLTAIDEKLKEILPEGSRVWNPGGFDIVSLSFKSPVWKKSDSSASPTGGRVTMKLEIWDKAVVVSEVKYDPEHRNKQGQ